MENQNNIGNQNPQQIGLNVASQFTQENRVNYVFYDPKSLNIHSAKVQIVAGLITIFGLLLFVIIYAFFFEVNLFDLFNNPYAYMNILILSCFTFFFLFIIFAVVNQGGLHKLKTPIPLSYRFNTLPIVIEVILFIYFGLKNNPLWLFFFILSFLHISLFYKHYKKLIVKVDSETVGKEKAEEYYLATIQGLKFVNLYYLVIPVINLIEIYLVWTFFGVTPNEIIYLSLFIVVVLIQDLIILKVFLNKKPKNGS